MTYSGGLLLIPKQWELDENGRSNFLKENLDPDLDSF